MKNLSDVLNAQIEPLKLIFIVMNDTAPIVDLSCKVLK